jgi:hypothetical protein
LPMPTVAPRGPSVQLTPEPLTFMRTPGASLMDRRNRKATRPPLCLRASMRSGTLHHKKLLRRLEEG